MPQKPTVNFSETQGSVFERFLSQRMVTSIKILLLLQFFSKALVFKIVNPFPNKPWFLRVCNYKSFRNNVGREEIVRNEHFSLSHRDNFLPFSNLEFSLEESEICLVGEG